MTPIIQEILEILKLLSHFRCRKEFGFSVNIAYNGILYTHQKLHPLQFDDEIHRHSQFQEEKPKINVIM